MNNVTMKPFRLTLLAIFFATSYQALALDIQATDTNAIDDRSLLLEAREMPLRDADALIKDGKAADAYALLVPLESEHLHDVRFYNLLGIAAMESGKPDMAVIIFKRVLDIDPNSAGVHMDMGRAYFQLGDFPHAKSEFKTVIKSNPQESIRTTVKKYLAAIETQTIFHTAVEEEKERVSKQATLEEDARGEAELKNVLAKKVELAKAAESVRNNSSPDLAVKQTLLETEPKLVIETPKREPKPEPKPEPIQESVKFDISEFTIVGNSLLPDEKIRTALATYIGAGRGIDDLNKAAEALRHLYQKAGYPIVQVALPAQTLDTQKVVLKVVEDKLRAVTISGNSAHNEKNIRDSLPPLEQGKSLNVDRLGKAILLANENSSKQVAVNIKAGEELGDIVAQIDVNEDKVSKVIASIDNTGTASTGLNKFNLAYQNANLFNLDHALTVQYSGSASHPNDIYSLSVGYHLPMYQQGISADLTAAYSNSNTQNGTLYFAGKGDVLGEHLNFPLPNWGDVHHKLVVGVDYKLSKNSFTACTGTCGTITEIPFSAMYYAQVVRPTFQGNGSITLVANKSGSSEADYQQASPNVAGSIQAKPTWNAWRINGSAGFMLPHDWQTRIAGNAQYSSDLLIPEEQFGAGGANTVRAYPERIIAGDKGFNTNLELYTPDLGVNYLTNLRALIFWDEGKVYNFVVGMPSSTEIASYGLGLRMAGKNANLKLDLGRTQKPYSNGTTTIKKGMVRGDFSLSVIF